MENCIRAYKNGTLTVGGWYFFRICFCCKAKYEVRSLYSKSKICPKCRPLVRKEYLRLQRIALKEAYFNVREMKIERPPIGKI